MTELRCLGSQMHVILPFWPFKINSCDRDGTSSVAALSCKLFLTPAVDAAVGGRLGLILSCLFTAAFTAGMSTATNSVALTAWYCAGRYVSLSPSSMFAL